ncbi:MAG: DUF2069 domain-containing protein [Gammaproteobacteria bacterium]|nr:DUF2069 domain-containing protein [Gammaproteobacteria bacterium]
MSWHPLRSMSLIFLLGLMGSQLGLVFWLETEYRLLIAGLLFVPLLLPIRGIIANRHYTFKWTGFLTLLYFCIGVSEAFVNPEHRLYSSLTLLFSCLLFFTSIYYSRYLRLSKAKADSGE